MSLSKKPFQSFYLNLDNIRMFWLRSSGKTISLHSNKLGLYIMQNRTTNERSVYRHHSNEFYFYYIVEYNGVWMV